MTSRAHSLRSTFTSVAVAGAALVLLATSMIAILATLLHEATVAMQTSAESIRIAEETELELVLYAQAKDPLIRDELSGSLRGRLAQLQAYTSDAEEDALLRTARERVNAYLTASEQPGLAEADLMRLRGASYNALEQLVNTNVAQAQATTERAARFDYLANLGGILVAALIVSLGAFVVYWLRGPALRPIEELSRTMEKFGRGDRTVRATVAGFRELQDMAMRFNEMASLIDRQREDQRAFLAGIAHDLRTPLSALLLTTNAARADTSLPPDHRARRALERNARQLSRLERMVTDFVDAARIEAGELELRLEECDIRAPLRSAWELFDGTSARHELTLSLPDAPVLARVDPLRIEQVANNLLSNAIKYSPEGGNVELRLERANSFIVLTVTDQGLGMSPELRKHLFEPFKRGLSREGIPGVGLGLFVVRRIVEAHGGRIEVESALGQGSTFRVHLPGL